MAPGLKGSRGASQDDPDALREACLCLLAKLGHPVHHGILTGIVRANTPLTPSRGQVLFVLTGLRADGRVERTRAGVYSATLAGESGAVLTGPITD